MVVLPLLPLELKNSVPNPPRPNVRPLDIAVLTRLLLLPKVFELLITSAFWYDHVIPPEMEVPVELQLPEPLVMEPSFTAITLAL